MHKKIIPRKAQRNEVAIERRIKHCDKSHTSNDLKGLYESPAYLYVPRKKSESKKKKIGRIFSVYECIWVPSESKALSRLFIFLRREYKLTVFFSHFPQGILDTVFLEFLIGMKTKQKPTGKRGWRISLSRAHFHSLSLSLSLFLRSDFPFLTHCFHRFHSFFVPMHDVPHCWNIELDDLI